MYKYSNGEHFDIINKMCRNIDIQSSQGQVILAETSKDLTQFYFCVYVGRSAIRFICIYGGCSYRVTTPCTINDKHLERFQYAVCELLPKYWTLAIPEEDKEKLLHSIQNLYSSPDGTLTKSAK